MSVFFNQAKKIWALHTPDTTYMIGLAGEGYIGHIYYGRKIKDTDMGYLLRQEEIPYIPDKYVREKNMFLDVIPMEYPEMGMGDYREGCICIRNAEGFRGSEFLYKNHQIQKGKPKLSGLPATFAEEKDCETLVITCEDRVSGLELELFFSVFSDLNVITRSAKLINKGKKEVFIERMLSACLDMDDRNCELLTLCGAWARERRIERAPLRYGRQNVASFRGTSSHQEHPFFALVSSDAGEDNGEVYAMHFVYSGNFLAQVEKTPFDQLRMTMGIHPEGFSWKLNPGESFTAPEVVMVYSGEGIGEMTRTLHDLYRNHLIRSSYKNRERPILINNWEATYFDFNEEKLLDMAREAAKLGIELFVMDDGWFGKRNSDEGSLGDWTVNQEKIPGGLKKLTEQIGTLGMKFGIWFEPEMISPDSDLYRVHPDWAIGIPGRTITQSRAQYVLDLSRKEVVDYVYGAVASILRSADISYIKWDMNRQLTSMGSKELEPDRQGELYHRYMLGVYELQERLMAEFPELLLENCSGGGARFDPGMLYYSPQIWCSDDTDAMERLMIQEGTAMIYPLSAIGSHVSACPNHTVGRITPFSTRGHVALGGTFGYELDITKLSPEEKEEIRSQIALYHKYSKLMLLGDYYRLASVRENRYYDSWMVVSKDKTEALVTWVQVLAQPNVHSKNLRLKGLLEQGRYWVENQIRMGDSLMYAGILIAPMPGDCQSRLIEIRLAGMCEDRKCQN